MTSIDEARVREILDGCEGVTPGPWRRPPKTPYVNRDAGPYPGDTYGTVTVAECGDWKDEEIAPFNKDRWMADAAHIARLDPDTVRALCTELLRLREIVNGRS